MSDAERAMGIKRYELSDAQWASNAVIKRCASTQLAITAASASSNADGAAAVLLMRRSEVEGRGLPVFAEIKALRPSRRCRNGTQRRPFS